MRRVLMVLLLCYQTTSFASDALGHRAKLWTAFSVTGHLGQAKQYDYQLQLHARFANQSSALEQRQIKLSIGGDLNSRNHLWLSYSFHGDVPNDLSTPEREYRFQQELSTIWQQNNYFISTFRSRLEERKSLDDSAWAFRFRERLQYDFNLLNNKTIHPILSDEILLNLNNPKWITPYTFDQNRFTIGLTKAFSDSYHLQVGYMNQFKIRNRNRMNHILVLALEYYRD